MRDERLLKILKAPHVSEKTTQGAGEYSQIAFKVIADAKKPEIRQAVEKFFAVKVKSVRVCNVKSKAARFGRTQGRTKGWKKAYVMLEKDQEIDLASAQV